MNKTAGGTDFTSLLNKLERHIARATKGKPVHVDRTILAWVVETARATYEGTRFSAVATSKNSLHEIAKPAFRVRELLTRDENYTEVLVALGAPIMLGLGPDQAGVQRAAERHETLLHALDDIVRGAPAAPRKRPRGRQPRPRELRFVVGFLAEQWVVRTGKPFKQAWHTETTGKARGKRKPMTDAAQFIYDVIEFIDFQRLGELPDVTRKIVADFRNGRQDRWWRETAEAVV